MPYTNPGVITVEKETRKILKKCKREDQTWNDFMLLVVELIKEKVIEE